MNEQDYRLLIRCAEEKIEEFPEGYLTEEEAKHEPDLPSVWAVAANIVQEHPFGEDGEIRRGTKNFKPGAKVYVVQENWRHNVEVTGHSRGGRIIKVWTRRAYLENPRATLVYSPKAIRHLTNYRSEWGSVEGYRFFSWKGDEESRIKAEEMAARFSQRE